MKSLTSSRVARERCAPSRVTEMAAAIDAKYAASVGDFPSSKPTAALMLARAGTVDQAERIAKSLDQEFPLNQRKVEWGHPARAGPI